MWKALKKAFNDLKVAPYELKVFLFLSVGLCCRNIVSDQEDGEEKQKQATVSPHVMFTYFI